MESAVANGRPPARPVLDVVTAAGRYAKRTKIGYTEAEVAQALGVPKKVAYHVLTSMVCGGLLFMRCEAHPTTAPHYAWVYVPTARCWRMMKATARRGGPTEQELRDDMSSVLVYGTRDPRVRRW